MKAHRKTARMERAWVRTYKIDAYHQQDGICIYCKEPLPLAQATADHVRPRKLNGQTRPDNIAASCLGCNRAKGHRTRAEFMRAIHEPNFQTDPWPLYLACLEIRLKLRVSAACRRLRKIIQTKVAP